ncbi:MAG: hypothetical protein IJA86_01680 [Clostridia bacterium]|nr:hypothetical protein [Clostridia bacterium]
MKRIVTVILTVFVLIALLLSFASCNSYGYVNQALKKAAGWDAVDFDMKTDVHVTTGDKTEDLSSEYSVKIQYIDTLDPITMAKTKVTLYGETVPADVYQMNNSYYVLTNNDAVKLKSGHLIEGAGFLADWKSVLNALPSSVVKLAEEKDNGDGTKTATMPVSEDLFEEIYKSMLTQWQKKLLTQYAEGASISEFRVTDPKISVTVNTGTGILVCYAGECRLEMTAEVSQGVTTEISAVFEPKLFCNAKGKDVSFELPYDYEDYKISDGVNLNPHKVLSNAIAGAIARKNLDASLSLTLNGEAVSTKHILANGAKTDSWTFAWNETSVYKDNQIKSEVYYADGWYYTNVYGELTHLKYERSKETDAAYGYENEIVFLLHALEESDFKSATAVSNDDGTRTFTIGLTNDRFKKTQADLIERAKSVTGSGNAVAFSNASVELIVDKKGTLKKYAVSFTMNTKIENQQTAFDFTYSLVYNNVGNAVEINPLEGYETFLSATERKQEIFGNANQAIKNILSADALNAYIFYSQYADVGLPDLIQINKKQESVTAAIDLKTNPKHFSQITVTEKNNSHKEDIYCEDGIFYIKSEIAESVKEKEENLTEQNIFWLIRMIQELPEEYFERISVTCEDGNNILSVSLEIDELKELFPAVAESMGIDIFLPKMTYQYVKESVLSVTMNEKNELVSYQVKLVTDFGIDAGNKVLDGEAELEIYYEFNTDRSDISITPPEGYQNFPEAK